MRMVCLIISFVLKLNVMQIYAIFFLIVSLMGGWFFINPQLDLVRIQSPKNGDYVQGTVAINGTVTGTDFQRAEISFRYQESQSQSWFIISQIETPIVDDVLANWDTSIIADGTYQIMVLAYYDNGRQQETIINNVNVRNYTPFDPVKTEPTKNNQILTTSEESTESIILPADKPIPTSMPPNELIVTPSQFILTAVQGAFLGVLFLFVIALFVIIRRRKLG